MTTDQCIEVLKAITALLAVLAWPAVAVFVLVRFGASLREFFGSLSELTFKAAGIEATAKRRQAEVAAALGAAIASSPAATSDTPSQSASRARDVAHVVAEHVTTRTVRRATGRRVLWVDDRPKNNVFERRSLEALGIAFEISVSTEDALSRLAADSFDAVISDMGRPPDTRAGYTLLDALRQQGNRTPYIIYAASNAPEHKREAREHGALGSTNRADELFELVLQAVGADGTALVRASNER